MSTQIDVQSLVTNQDGGLFVSSVIIAENMDLMHDSILSTIEKYNDKFLELGELKLQDFKEALNISNNKSLLKKRVAYLLNENQVTFLFNLSRNNEKVVNFKLALTKAFDYMKNTINLQSTEIQLMKQMITTLEKTESRVTTLEQTKRLEAWQEKSLQDAKNQKVYEIANFMQTEDKGTISKLHRKIWSLLKKKYHLPRYNELPSIKFEEARSYINNLSFGDLI